MRRLDPDQENPEPRLLGLVEDLGMPGDVNPGLDDKGLINLVLDDQIAELFASFQVREEIVIADEYDVGGNRLQFVNDGFDRSFRVASLLPEWIETERAELAFERASPRRQDRVERVAAESHAVLGQVVVVPSQGPIRKRKICDIGQRMVFVVDDSAVPAIGESADIRAGDPRGDLSDDLFALTSYDHVDIRATVKQVFDVQRCLVASDDRGHLMRQLSDEITSVLEPGLPSEGDAHQVDLGPNERAEHFRVLVVAFMPQVEKRDLADQIFHARDDVLKAGRRENPPGGGRIPEVGVQSKNVFVLDHITIIPAVNLIRHLHWATGDRYEWRSIKDVNIKFNSICQSHDLCRGLFVGQVIHSPR